MPEIESTHFTLETLAEGVVACIHKPGGGAFSNAGIVDLGDRTLIIDAFDTRAAGKDLRRAAETLSGRPIDTLVLTHAHSDHWVGASAFDATTTMLATEPVREACKERGAEMTAEFEDPAEWEAWLHEMEAQFETEGDAQVRAGLETAITRARYTIAEMAEFEPRDADETFRNPVTFQGSTRLAELRSLGRGHSTDDAVLLLPEDGIAFIGDVGFFDRQPYMGDCDVDGYREQLRTFQEADFRVLVPGHGPVGGVEDIALELRYLDVIEELVTGVAQRGGSFEEAMGITLPAPFDRWQMGGRWCFGVNVRTLFARAGGEVPEE